MTFNKSSHYQIHHILNTPITNFCTIIARKTVKHHSSHRATQNLNKLAGKINDEWRLQSIIKPLADIQWQSSEKKLEPN